jgi:hypothetical protein
MKAIWNTALIFLGAAILLLVRAAAHVWQRERRLRRLMAEEAKKGRGVVQVEASAPSTLSRVWEKQRTGGEELGLSAPAGVAGLDGRDGRDGKKGDPR